MNIKRGKSLIAFVLVIAMLLTAIPIRNRVMAAENKSIALQFDRYESNNLYFTTTATDLVSAKFYVVDATVIDATGVETKQKVALYATSASALRTMPAEASYFEKGTTVGKVLIIEEGATLTQAARPGSGLFPTPTEGGNSYTLSEDITIVKNTDGTWKQKKTEALNMEFASSDNDYVYFNTTATDLVSAKFYVVDATVVDTTGAEIKQKVALYATSTSNLRIMPAQSSYFENGTTAGKAFTIEKGALLEEALRPTGTSNFPVPTVGGSSYILSEDITILKNSSGAWSQKETKALNLEFASSTADYIYFNTTATDLASAKFYVVDATVVDTTGGVTEQKVALYANGTSTLYIMPTQGSYFENGTTAGKAFIIKEGAILEPAARPGSGLFPTPSWDRNSYILSEEITIVKNSNGTWSEQVTGNVTLEFVSADDNNLYFNTTATDLAQGKFYVVDATVVDTEGVETKQKVALYSTSTSALRIMPAVSNYFEKGTTIGKTLIIEKGALLEEAARPTGTSDFPVPTVAGSSYILSEEITTEKNEDGTWSEKVPESVTLEYTEMDASGNFIFKGIVGDNVLPNTNAFYLVKASIDGTEKQIYMNIQANGRLVLYSNYFGALGIEVPTESLDFEKGVIFTEAMRDTTTQQIVPVVDGDKYRLSQAFGIKKDNFGLWDVDVETINLGNLTMIFDHEDGNDNFYFVGEFADEKTLTSATYYKGVATIDGTTTQYITLGINAEGNICIYEGYFTWKSTANKKVPEKTFKIATGTTFRQVYNENNSWKETMDGETPNIFTVKNDLSLVCIDDVWHAESITGDANGDGVTNVCDLVRYLKYNQTPSNTAIATGADINGNSIYDDIDDLRKILVGEDIPTATYFSLVQNGKSDYTIVTPVDATTNEQVAANELQYFIKESTGATLSIVSETDSLTADSGKYLYVGDTNAAEEASVILASSAQKKNGYLIKTIGDDCYLCGYSDIGTKNSVYEFLDHAFDYEYYAVDEIYLTKTSNVKLLDYNLEVTPDFEWRMAPNGEVIYAPDGKFATSASGEIANRMRFNLVYDSFVTGYDYHNSFTILPPATYQAEHPEWYSRDAAGEVIKNGTEPAQLCYSNEEMCTEFTQQLLSMLDSSTVENVMLGQQDTEKWCQCEECSAAYNKYGTNAAVLVKFANQVQAKVNAWFKENRTGETPTRMVIFAYQSTLKPPVIWDEESNSWIAIDNDAILNEDSSVMYAINDMQMHVPFEDTDPESLETPYGRLIGWDACSDSIYAWTYSLYMHHGLLFSNTIDVMAQNYSLLKKHGVSMIKEQADHYQRNKNSGFSRLETYLMSKMQWDTSLNQEELIDDFFNNYFGEAADTMQELFNGERQNILAKYSDSNLGFKGTFGEDVLTSNFWTESEVKEYQRLIEQAYDDIASIQTTNPTRYAKLCERIQLEAIQFDYIDCSLYSTDIETRNQFKNHFESLGLYSYAEHKSIGTLWKEWGIDCNQTMSFSEMSSDGKFNFHLHRETKPGPYKTTAYIDGTDQEIEIQVAEDGYSASITLNTNPNNTLKISKGAILMPVNDDGVKDISRPIYKLEAELYISNSTGEWKAGNEISKEPTNMTMTFNYVSDKDEDGKYDFNFKVNGDIQTAFYKAYAEIDGEVKPVLLRSSDASRKNQEIWIYEGFFNDNAKSADSILPQVTLIFKAGTVLTPVTDSTYTVNPDMGGYILEQDVTVTYDNGTWK